MISTLAYWRDPAGRHVGAADGLDLLHVAELLVVEQLVEVHDDLVQQPDALHLVTAVIVTMTMTTMIITRSRQALPAVGRLWPSDNNDNDHDDNDDQDNNNDDDNGDDAPHPLVDVLRVELSEVWNACKQDSSIRPANIFTNNCMVDLENTENLYSVLNNNPVFAPSQFVLLAPQVL